MSLIVRPARRSDIDAICDLAELAGPGFTSLSVGRERLAQRVDDSEASFAANISAPKNERYLLILEDTGDGTIAGMSAIKSRVGNKAPFFNYKLLRLTQASGSLDAPFGMDILMLVNEYTGASEVGTLFVHPKYRGKTAKKRGAGRLISQARYMVMAIAPQRFSETVISELRGAVDQQGNSAFWDAVGRPFFRMNFNEADEISAASNNEFIVDLMPRYPIYVDLLPEGAREVIGKTHPAGEGARRYLEAEGFRYDRVVDIFDGGPCMTGLRDNLRTVRDSRVVNITAPGDTSLTALVSNNKINDLRVILTQISMSDDGAGLTDADCALLNLTRGDAARIWIKRS